MDEQLKQIGERLRGLRDVLDLTAEEVAETCGIDVDVYEKIERGEVDITISKLMKIARKYGVSAEELMFAEAPRMKSYFVVRKGQGMSVERTKAYKYQSLVSGFVNHDAEAQNLSRLFHCSVIKVLDQFCELFCFVLTGQLVYIITGLSLCQQLFLLFLTYFLQS